MCDKSLKKSKAGKMDERVLCSVGKSGKTPLSRFMNEIRKQVTKECILILRRASAKVLRLECTSVVACLRNEGGH